MGIDVTFDEWYLKFKETIDNSAFIKRFGYPVTAIVSKPYHFAAKKYFHGTKTNWVSVPEDLWPRHQVFLEYGIVARQVIQLDVK